MRGHCHSVQSLLYQTYHGHAKDYSRESHTIEDPVIFWSFCRNNNKEKSLRKYYSHSFESIPSWSSHCQSMRLLRRLFFGKSGCYFLTQTWSSLQMTHSFIPDPDLNPQPRVLLGPLSVPAASWTTESVCSQTRQTTLWTEVLIPRLFERKERIEWQWSHSSFSYTINETLTHSSIVNQDLVFVSDSQCLKEEHQREHQHSRSETLPLFSWKENRRRLTH